MARVGLAGATGAPTAREANADTDPITRARRRGCICGILPCGGGESSQGLEAPPQVHPQLQASTVQCVLDAAELRLLVLVHHPQAPQQAPVALDAKIEVAVVAEAG